MLKTWSDEWKRTNPDIMVYLPREENGFDAVNQHFLVKKSPTGAWLAFWTRGADEGEPNQSIVVSRSTNRGITWSEPTIIDGPPAAHDSNFKAPDRREGKWKTAGVSDEEDRKHAGIASWGFPIIAEKLGRIYCFYQKNEGVAEYRYDLCGVLRGRYSEDDGCTWSKETFDLPIRRTFIDNLNPDIPINWIVWQIPYITSHGEVIAPFTRWPSHKAPKPNGAECWFLRFDNILTEQDISKLSITTLPEGERGLRVPSYGNPSNSFAEEPAIVELSDGRFFCVMRTAIGYIAYSISEDRGHTWSTPAPLYRDSDSELMLNPVVPCPIYKLKDGRYILLYYKNKGDANGGHFPCGYSCWRTNRYPAFISVGHEDLKKPCPVRFSPAKMLLDTQGKGLGPGGRTDAGTYPSLLEDGNDRILFYPDRKHFLLGKRLTDEWLAVNNITKSK